MARIDYNMLVRDKYAEILESRGKKKCNTSVVDDSDLLDRLAEKLEAEVGGFICEYDNEDDEKAIAKLADVAEVIKNILSNLGVTEDAFSRICEARNAMYGTYENKVLLESVEDAEEDK